MFKRKTHQHIAELLKDFNAEKLRQSKCFFGGGTAIVLCLGEYRESIDIDFICSSVQGFRLLRNTVNSASLGDLLRQDLKLAREVRMERDKISTFIEASALKIKVEFILEGNVDISGQMNPQLGVPVLAREDMYATKLMANADRGLDRATMSRDIIDLAMMIQKWGSIPRYSLDKAETAYGESIIRGFGKSLELIQEAAYLDSCLKKMQMDVALSDMIRQTLEQEHESLVGNSDEPSANCPQAPK